ncbi:MAG TPA: hypothetical protein VNF47_03525 [Streptosporangiaceae bacterium]|nr:hypothetical protein [Streptosporangiaceae bacterium]
MSRSAISQISGARIDLSTACLLDHELDEAAEALQDVLDVPPSLRNMSLAGWLQRAKKVLLSGEWSKDAQAVYLDDSISDWLATERPGGSAGLGSD